MLKKNQKGFTLTELIAVIVVLAIILAITVPGITGIVKNSTMKAVESDAKLVLDSIRLKKIEDNTFDPITLTKSNVNNLLGLSDENYSALEVKINEGQTYIKITGQGKWSGFSACGTYFNMQVNEGDCYLDFNDPVITLLGDSFVSINVGQAYNDAGATANDVEDGDITGRIVKTGTVNPSVPGTYTITYNVSDTAGREAVSVTRTVYVIDVEAPVITILGDNPVNINVGGTYSDAGATALDDADGDVTSRIITTGTVNPSIAGTYTITYTVSDNAGHESTAVRTVNVIDNVLPAVSFSMNGNATWAKTRSTTVTVSDTHTGVNPSSLKYQWTTSTTAPTEASFATTFTNGETVNSPVGVTGTYYLWVLAKDNTGNTTIVSTNAFNLDNTVPSVPTSEVRYGSSTGTIRANNVSSWTNQTLWWGNFIATDAASGINRYEYSSECTGTITGTLGTSYTYSNNIYDICIRAVDNAGNISAWGSVTYIRADNTAPNVPTVSLNGYTSNTWTKNDVTQTFSSSDATSGIQKYQYSVDSGASWGDLVGSWTINWDGQWTFYIRAVDNAGNISANSSPYIIKRDTVAPVITRNGSSPVSVPQGSSYTDAGATATDNASGLASVVQVTSNVNPNVIGTYTVTYNVSDNAGNAATPVTRTVNVVSNPANVVFGAYGAWGITKYTYANNQWTSSTVISGESVSSLAAGDSNTVFKAYGAWGIAKYSYVNNQWTSSMVISGESVSSLAAGNPNTVFKAYGAWGIAKYAYANNQWNSSMVISGESVSSLAAANANTVFKAYGSWGIVKYTYSNNQWTTSTVVSGVAVSALAAGDANTVFKTYGGDGITKYAYVNNQWTSSTVVASGSYDALAAADANTVFASNSNGIIKFSYVNNQWISSQVTTTATAYLATPRQ